MNSVAGYKISSKLSEKYRGNNLIYNSIKNNEIHRNKFNKGSERFLHWKV